MGSLKIKRMISDHSVILLTILGLLVMETPPMLVLDGEHRRLEHLHQIAEYFLLTKEPQNPQVQ